DTLRRQEGHVRTERDILKSALLLNIAGEAEWIIRLEFVNTTIVLEYMGGDDLLNILIERYFFDEGFSECFYVAEAPRARIMDPQTLLATESCHKHGFIHYDIKHDNFLFDPSDHIKLSDFSLS
ncbi:kinase-like domain-containing protein, partial [Mycena leptocephala]